MPLFIGLMSGTSADGVDASLVDICQRDGKQVINPVGHYYLPFPHSFADRIRALYQKTLNEVETAGVISQQLSEFYAAAVNQLLQQHNLTAEQICAIGNHGQTIRHCVDFNPPFSVQIGNHALLAELTGIDVVGDFRSADIAAGGQGAPLVPAFHQHIFARENNNQVIVNIGGIANITAIDQQGEVIAGFDTGPGNALLNDWIFKTKQLSFDKDGLWALSGKVNEHLLSLLLSDDYFTRPAPKSTGREYFHLAWLDTHLAKLSDNIAAQDIQATLVDLTAITIINSVKSQFANAQLWICGGGAHNPLLMQRLAFYAQANYSVASSLEKGIDPDWVESQCFAWLAYCFCERLPANIASLTGAKRAKVLGCLYPA
ncbi:anhydro-N-acetylmuramic acid kinase [Catenovulum agarivorans DS-2]|uniref:Anhydro-N-acetylmuramic acid kinase n=1 Tax=Catenovulum agarivorans DS-2 TaxID=1328313 RepID=W7QMC8_9ALTE|nr:anhydro-N-acetylmuramic acid kinase [Catenovulum agarivorans]EWH10092.1 anhydro-N-acetylmuramic acid kinase [Catenovulum agarivorans DS-2]